MKPRPTIWESQRAVITMARQLARRQVIKDIRDHGLKLHQFSPADIALLVTVQLVGRPEHIAKAKAICAELHQRELTKRELLRLRRARAKLLTNAQRNAPCETTTIPVQISGAK
jgi:hypothetical protein